MIYLNILGNIDFSYLDMPARRNDVGISAKPQFRWLCSILDELDLFLKYPVLSHALLCSLFLLIEMVVELPLQ